MNAICAFAFRFALPFSTASFFYCFLFLLLADLIIYRKARASFSAAFTFFSLTPIDFLNSLEAASMLSRGIGSAGKRSPSVVRDELKTEKSLEWIFTYEEKIKVIFFIFVAFCCLHYRR